MHRMSVSILYDPEYSFELTFPLKNFKIADIIEGMLTKDCRNSKQRILA
jgi:hypothetical protein